MTTDLVTPPPQPGPKAPKARKAAWRPRAEQLLNATILIALVVGVATFFMRQRGLQGLSVPLVAWAVAAVSGILAAFVTGRIEVTVLQKKPDTKIVATGGFAVFLIVLQFFAGHAPLAASTYRIRVTVRDANKIPVNQQDPSLQLWSSCGGEKKWIDGGIQFDIPASDFCHDGSKVNITADYPSRHLHGFIAIELSAAHSVTTDLVLQQRPDARVRGHVLDGNGRLLEGVRVSVLGHPETVVTKGDGFFELPANAGLGEEVMLHAEHPDFPPLSAIHPAGDAPAVLTLRRE